MSKVKAVDKAALKARAEADLLTFIKLVAPHRMLGAVHEELCMWWTRDDAKDNQLVLLPRDHQKSVMVAYRVAWWITKHPESTILYVSATAGLAEKQLKFIKDILTSERYRLYWPEMVNEREADREKWSQSEICVDHPVRKKEGIRDSTVMACGITANTTGLHCTVAVMDDVVVPDNAYTETGRESVKAFYSQLSSIETTGAREWVVGTRYHPNDLYKELIEMAEVYWDEIADEEVENLVYETFERTVETNGEFLWPKMRRTDGKTFGFDERELARKKAKYLDTTQFYAQYYNNPNSAENQLLETGDFQHYDRENVRNISGGWYIGDRDLTVYAAIDFAYTVGTKSDYTVIVVVGVSPDNEIFVLDIVRFKTNKISDMYSRVCEVYDKWKFRKLRAEVVAAQSLIVTQFREYMRQQNVVFTIDEYHPPKSMRKEERIAATLEPRYKNKMIWHYKGGNCSILESELMANNSEHDDVKDCLAAVVEIAKSSTSSRTWSKQEKPKYHSRFGGVGYR